jgi:hypothetical protein
MVEDMSKALSADAAAQGKAEKIGGTEGSFEFGGKNYEFRYETGPDGIGAVFNIMANGQPIEEKSAEAEELRKAFEVHYFNCCRFEAP